MVTSPALAQSISSENVKSNPTMQATIDISNIELGKKVILPDGAILTPISKEEYVARLASERNISFQEAYEMESTDLKSLSRSYDSRIYYYSYSKTFSYGKNTTFKADLQATLKTWSSGSFREIKDVVNVTSRRKAGTYNYNWIQTGNGWSDPPMGSSSFPTLKVTLGVSGYFEVKTSYSLNISKNLPGFTLTGSGGLNYIYQSDTMNMISTYDIYENY